MKLILNAQLSPKICPWLEAKFGFQVIHVRDLSMMTASDHEIFSFAKKQEAVLISKDSDFVEMVEHFGPPPQLIWLTVGNTTNQHLQKVFESSLQQALNTLQTGISIVEIHE